MNNQEKDFYLDSSKNHLTNELLPFWTKRCVDEKNGGYLTNFDTEGKDTGLDEKSFLAQARTIYTLSSAHRAGYGKGELMAIAKHGVDFIIDKFWDQENGGFFWLSDRAGNILIDQKIIYGHSFAIYSLSEYTLATGDSRGLEYAEKVFDLLQKYCADTHYGGYFEMFSKDWKLNGPGSAGGDRKTLDVHMHLMEAFTTLYECSGKEIHKRKLQEIIALIIDKILHPEYKTGIPQFYADWKIAPQIKFDIVWGWDRFTEDGAKASSEDNTSYGHNVEFAWLLLHALDIMEVSYKDYLPILLKSFEHCIADGVDWENGGIYVEGSHAGGVYDREKEFWQQAEVLIGMLDAYRIFGKKEYLDTYKNVHKFLFDKMIKHEVGEWWPLMTRKGEPIWKHMSHNWKVNYHTVRAMVQSIIRLEKMNF
ncbi:AGE family epimerase/isomerase [Flexithrix dorotheae]|uniref:AGE family epimerase/isomerase n=1 Tax=Flexithrix dorotheae TaxID=70993 RepID=UPI0005C72AED|nr:AGE family epimerase/isomerase [Flexithrix dorotheae]